MDFVLFLAIQNYKIYLFAFLSNTSIIHLKTLPPWRSRSFFTVFREYKQILSKHICNIKITNDLARWMRESPSGELQ